MLRIVLLHLLLGLVTAQIPRLFPINRFSPPTQSQKMVRCQHPLTGEKYPVYSGIVLDKTRDTCHVAVCNLIGAWEYFQHSNNFVCKAFSSYGAPQGEGYCVASSFRLPVGSYVPTNSDGNTCTFSVCVSRSGRARWQEIRMPCTVISKTTLNNCYINGKAYDPCRIIERIPVEGKCFNILYCDADGYMRYLDQNQPVCAAIKRRVTKTMAAIHYRYYDLSQADDVHFEENACQAAGQWGDEDSATSVRRVSFFSPDAAVTQALSRDTSGRKRRDTSVELCGKVEAKPDGTVSGSVCLKVKTNKCISRSALATLATGEQRPLEQLKTGDVVLTLDKFSSVKRTPVIGFIHNSLKSDVMMVRLTSNNVSISMTSNHHVIMRKTNEQPRFGLASEVQLGDLLLVETSNSIYSWQQVTEITLKIEKGAIAPLTATGDLLVNGILVGCYAEADGSYVHALHHFLFKPLMQLWDIFGLPGVTADEEGLHPVFNFFQHLAQGTVLRHLFHPEVLHQLRYQTTTSLA